MTALLKRDLMVLLRQPRGWLLALTFFVLFLSIIAIALQGDIGVLNRIAAPVIWLAVVFSLLLTFETLFTADVQNGIMEQYRLAGLSGLSIVLSKFIMVFLTSIVPLALAIPLIGVMYQLPMVHIAAITLSLLIGAPAIIALGLVSAALLSGQRSAGFLIILLTLPFMIPVIIFALAGINAYPIEGLDNPGFIALAGLSLLSFAICIPASSAALKINME